jgi:hypothetical protein
MIKIVIFFSFVLFAFSQNDIQKKLVGEWVYNQKKSLKMTKKNGGVELSIFRHMALIFSRNGKVITERGQEAKYKILKNNSVHIVADEKNELLLKFDGNDLISEIDWAKGKKVYLVLSKKENMKGADNLTNIEPLLYHRVYRSTEKIDGKYLYLFFTKDGGLYGDDKPIKNIKKYLKKSAPHSFYVKGKKIIVNDTFEIKALNKKKFIYQVSGLKITYKLID